VIEVAVSPSRIRAGVADLEIRLTNTGSYACFNVIFVIKMPVGVMRLRGPERMTQDKLPPGQTVTSPLRVRADTVGHYRLTSPLFSYQDHVGKTHRKTGFAVEIIVDQRPGPAPEPRVTAELQTPELPLGEWRIMRCRLSNVGDLDATGLELTLDGQVNPGPRSRRYALERLRAGASVDAPFFVQASEPGAHVPVYLDFSYNGPRGRQHGSTTASISVNSGPAPESVTVQESRGLVRVLFLAANPAGTSRLRLDEELREIEQAIRQGRDRDNIEIRTVPAVRAQDITAALIDVDPYLVHFAGHGGSAEGSFVVKDDFGHAHVIPVAGLVQAFKAVGQGVRCVIVNACQTERLAQELAAAGPCVIGMRHPVGDRSAIRFSIGFYQALAAGKSIETAFDVAVAQLMMTPGADDAQAPLLLRGAGRAC
jgi:hypothetical protein